VFDTLPTLTAPTGSAARGLGGSAGTSDWLQNFPDLAVVTACFAIPLVVSHSLWKQRKCPLQYGALIVFASFMVAIGVMLLMQAPFLRDPLRTLLPLKLATALLAWAAVVALIRLLPSALARGDIWQAHTEPPMPEAPEPPPQEAPPVHNELDEFAALVKHDIRNSVSSAIFMAELTKESVAGNRPHELPERLDLIVTTLRDLDEMVDKIHERCAAKHASSGKAASGDLSGSSER
jgi:signal transduction histidine kinase